MLHLSFARKMLWGDSVTINLTFSAPLSGISAERFCCHVESAQRDREDLCSGGGIFSRPWGRDPVSSTEPEERGSGRKTPPAESELDEACMCEWECVCRLRSLLREQRVRTYCSWM